MSRILSPRIPDISQEKVHQFLAKTIFAVCSSLTQLFDIKIFQQPTKQTTRNNKKTPLIPRFVYPTFIHLPCQWLLSSGQKNSENSADILQVSNAASETLEAAAENVSKLSKKQGNHPIQGGPLLVINRVKNPCKWPYTWVTGVVTPISGAIILLITGRGPPCRSPSPKSAQHGVSSRSRSCIQPPKQETERYCWWLKSGVHQLIGSLSHYL